MTTNNMKNLYLYIYIAIATLIAITFCTADSTKHEHPTKIAKTQTEPSKYWKREQIKSTLTLAITNQIITATWNYPPNSPEAPYTGFYLERNSFIPFVGISGWQRIATLQQKTFTETLQTGSYLYRVRTFYTVGPTTIITNTSNVATKGIP